MPKNTKEDQKAPEDCQELPEKSSPGDEQSKRNYYYDDACGYEIYTEDEDENEDD